MKIALIVLALVVALVLVVLVIGAALPRNHVVSRHVILHRPPGEVYETVRNFSAAPSWRPDLERVEMIATGDNHVRFREHGKQGAVTYDMIEDRPNEKIVTRIADQDLGYSGSWTYTFQSEADGTRLEITEAGEVSNILFRFMSRFVFGHTGMMEKYLAALGRKFGQEVSPQP
jgi:Polyketide cyclase / dehydrase and lipid transport